MALLWIRYRLLDIVHSGVHTIQTNKYVALSNPIIIAVFSEIQTLLKIISSCVQSILNGSKSQLTS